ncbi:MAG: hypothetical protein HGA45_38315 [Chloroflexales bacterium]|nr:hypothetical protein [Chloroflexales bacterium]
MSNQHKPPDTVRLLHELRHNDALQHQPVAEGGLDPQLALLRAWQAQRLAQTYADLLDEPASRPALRFFLSDLYAARDFSQRDHDIERIHSFLGQVLPAQTLHVLTEIITLNRLTTALDHDLCEVLVRQLGVTSVITTAQYAEGYRLCANYDARVCQIDLITTVLARVGAGSHRPVVGLAMKLAQLPAKQAGWGELYDGLKRGYAAFKQLRDVMAFVGTIAERERRILDQLYAGDADPFI